MAEWLKKQAEREAEKEQRRLERLQRKLKEPKHQFSDAEYQQQCHDLSERLEDSVLKGQLLPGMQVGNVRLQVCDGVCVCHCCRSAGVVQLPGEGGRHLQEGSR